MSNKSTFIRAFVFGVAAVFWAASRALAPDSAFYPRLVCVLIVLLGVLDVFAPPKRGEGEQVSGNTWLVIGLIALTALYVLLLTHVGFALLTPFYLGVSMRFMGVRNLKQVIAIAIGLTIALIVTFSGLFGVPLPTGLLNGLGF